MANGLINNVPVTSSRQLLAANGKYFNVTNPTPGTAIAYALQTTFSATANGLFMISNNNPVNGANIQLDRLSLTQTATVPATTLVMRFDTWNETGIVAMTGSAVTRTPVQLNTGAGFTQTTGAVVQSFAAGAATVPAAVGSRRLIDVGALNTGVTVVHDTYVVDFGADGPSAGTAGLTAARATASARVTTQMAPVIIAPQTTGWINMWWVTQTTNAPSFEFSLTYIEL